MSHLFRLPCTNLNAITDYGFATMCLKWSDPLGAASSDYDLYLLHPSWPAVIYASTDAQNGTQDPVECIGRLRRISTGRPLDLTGFRLLVVKAGGSNRYLHLNTHGGRLTIATYDPSAAINAIGVAATAATRAGGPGGVFDGTESVERFNSDGPRRIFCFPTAGPYAGRLLVHRRVAPPQAGRDRGRPRIDRHARVREVRPHVGGGAACRGHRGPDAAGQPAVPAR